MPTIGTALLVCVLCLPAARAAGGASFLVDALDVAARVADTTVPFIENRGQIDPAVAFYARTFAGTVFVTHAGEIIYALPARGLEAETDRFGHEAYDLTNAPGPPHRLASSDGAGWMLALRETLVDATPGPIRGLRPSDTVVNVFKGNDPARWQSRLPVFEAVDLGEVWPGVRLELVARAGNVEKRFTVAPGASPDVIRIRVEGGAPSLRRERNGQLTVPSDLGPVVFTRPVAFLKADGRPVTVAYAVRGDVYGFRVGPYDRSQPLVIDPLLASTYFGGASFDRGRRVAVDSEANVWLAGGTTSPDFPRTPGAYQVGFGGPEPCGQAFISKFSPDLRNLRASTFLGGTSGQEALGLALDGQGRPIVAGATSSPDFPTTTWPCSEPDGLRSRGFISRLSADLSTLEASGCVHAPTYSLGFHDVAVGADGSVAVATTNFDPGLPTTPDAFMPDFGSGLYCSVYVARYDRELTTLLAATWLGTSDIDLADRVGVDPAGNIVVAGETANWHEWPGTVRLPRGLAPGRGYPCYTVKLDANLTTLLGSTVLGYGPIHGLDVDTNGDVWLAGETYLGWPTTPGAFQTTCPAGVCGFVSRLANDGLALLASTLIGSRPVEEFGGAWGTAVARAPRGGVFTVGYTHGIGFPTTPGSYQPEYAGGYSAPHDMFVAHFDPDLRTLRAATLVGGRSDDYANDVAVTSDADVVILGSTGRSTVPFPTTPGAFDRNLGPTGALTVSIFTPDLLADPQPCLHGGDLDFDGATTMDDVQAAFYAVLGIYSPLPWEYCQADCNGDDRLTAGDTQAAFAKFLGLGACAGDEGP